MSDLRTPLARARGLGSARSGARHWLHQRLTAIVNLFLLLWFAVSAAALAGADYSTVVWWIRDPVVSVLLVLFVANLFYHLRLGLAVVIEDYVESEGRRLASIFAVTILTIVLALLAVIAILKVSLSG